MTMMNVIELWEMQNGNKGFFDDCVIPSTLIERKELFDYLCLEYGDMIPVDSYSETFHLHVVNFFKTHKWNIQKLCESLNFDYNPIENYRMDGTIDRDTGSSGREWKQDVGLVSAFDDNQSPISQGNDQDGNPKYSFIDTEHDRDLMNRNYHGDVDMDEHSLKFGNTGNTTYQKMIEEERKQAQFNIYKWIARHFSTELLITVW